MYKNDNKMVTNMKIKQNAVGQLPNIWISLMALTLFVWIQHTYVDSLSQKDVNEFNNDKHIFKKNKMPIIPCQES